MSAPVGVEKAGQQLRISSFRTPAISTIGSGMTLIGDGDTTAITDYMYTSTGAQNYSTNTYSLTTALAMQ